MRKFTHSKLEVARLYRGGLSPSDIAAEFGMTTKAVKASLVRSGIYAARGAGRRGSPAAIAKTEHQKATLAEHVAEGGSISAWGRDNGIADSWAFQLWAKIKRDLGAQAV